MTRTIVCEGCREEIPFPRGDMIQFIAIGVFLSGLAVVAIGTISTSSACLRYDRSFLARSMMRDHAVRGRS